MARKQPDINERLMELKGKMSSRAFAQATGDRPTTVWEYMKGRTPPAEYLARVCERFEINSWWMLTGKGEKSWKKMKGYCDLGERVASNQNLFGLIEGVIGQAEMMSKIERRLIEIERRLDREDEARYI